MGKFIQSLPILVSFILLISIFSVGAAKQSITENKITIISDKEAYNCEPIYNEKGQCLIRAEITIEYLAPEASTISVKSEFSTNVKQPEYSITATSNADSVAVIAKDSLKADKMLIDVAVAQEAIAAEAPIKEQPIDLGGKVIIGEEPKGDILAAEVVILSEPLEITKADEYTTDTIEVQPTDTQTIQLEFWADKDGKFNIVVDNNGITTLLDPIYNISVNAITPSWWLQYGYSLAPNMYNYSIITNITAGISDNNPSTQYQTSVRQPFLYSDMAFYYTMNCLTPIGSCDNSPYSNPIYLRPNTQIIPSYSPPLYYALNITNAINSGASAVSQPQHSISGNQNFTICATFNITSTGATQYVVSNFDPISGSGYGIYVKNDQKYGCVMKDDNSGEKTKESGTYNWGSVASVCCRRTLPNTMDLIVNATTLDSDVGNLDTNITTYGDLLVGGRGSLGTLAMKGSVDEIVMWRTYISNAQLTNYTLYGAALPNTAIEIQPYFNYNITDPTKAFLLIEGGINYPIRIYPMINSTDINPNNYTQTQIFQQDQYIPLSGVVSAGYNNPFRIVNLNPENVSIYNVYLVMSVNDTQAPSIYNCGVNDSYVNCSESVEWYCHITDNGQVNSAWGRVQFGNYFNITLPATQDSIDTTKWSVKLSPFQIATLLSSVGWNFSIAVNNTMVYVNATDLGGNSQQNITSGVGNTYGCVIGGGVTCVENWTQINTACGYNNTYLRYYLDGKNCETTYLLPLDNGTSYYCDYCAPSITSVATSGCVYHNGSYMTNYSYIDNNYYSCCAITGLISDCLINYAPYNISFTTGCLNVTTDFLVNHPLTCEYDLKSDDKCYFSYDLNRSGDWKCIGLVRTENGDLIQTTPEYTAKVDTIITLGSSDYENREYFTAYNGVGQAYFTKENLIFDGRSYVFSIECSNGTNRLQSDHLLAVEYSNLNTPVNRGVWAISQMGVIIFSLIGIVILLIVFAFLWNFNKRNTG